jgi:hypothetical protein
MDIGMHESRIDTDEPRINWQPQRGTGYILLVREDDRRK